MMKKTILLLNVAVQFSFTKPHKKLVKLFDDKLVYCDKSFPSQYLLVQRRQWKHQNNLSNLFKVNNKNTITTSMTSFWFMYC